MTEALLSRDKLLKNPLLWVSVAMLVVLVLPSLHVFASEIGGYISEKLIDRSGVSNSSLVIGMNNPQLDIGMSPAISTLPAVTKGKLATLRGNISDLNGFPEAIAWFEWGYDTGLGNVVGTQTVNATGTYTHDLDGLSLGRTVYYRFVCSADGTNYGNNISFPISTPSWTLLIVIASAFGVSVFVGILVLLRSSLTFASVLIAMIAALIGVIGMVVIIQTIMGLR